MPVSVSNEYQSAAVKPFVPSLYAGGTAGSVGALIGSIYATTKGYHAGIYGAAVGTQWFVLGSTFWFSRELLMLSSNYQRRTVRDDVLYSTGAGVISGAATGALRSRHNIIPGAIMVGLVGAAGQAGVTTLFSRLDNQEPGRPVLDRLSDSRWWPLKSLSDDDYEKMLNEKVLALEAEMSLIDDKIAKLRKQNPLAKNNAS